MTDDAVLLKKRETAAQHMLSLCTCFWVSTRSIGDKEGKWPSDAIDEFYSPLRRPRHNVLTSVILIFIPRSFLTCMLSQYFSIQQAFAAEKRRHQTCLLSCCLLSKTTKANRTIRPSAASFQKRKKGVVHTFFSFFYLL
jgi:hypothetical protein